MKRYEAYDSFLDIWVNEIPAHWEAHKMKYLFHERSEKGYPDELLLVASQNMGVVPKKVYGNRTVEAQKDLHLLKLVRVGDFVISLRSFQGGLEYAYYQGIISPAYTVLTPHEPITAGYFRYLAKSKLFIGLLTLCVTGIREGQNIDYEKLRNHSLPVPPRTEQDQIVRYLDWQVSKINRLIAAKRKEIALLKEQKQRKITEVVVHGLKPNVPHKDTGIAWIGSIPAHWHCVALKRCATVKSGITLGKQYPVGTNLVSVPYLRVANVQDGFVNIETVTNLNVTPEEAAQYRLPRGCVLMTEGGDRDKLGRGCVWNGEIENCIHQNHIFAVTVNDKLLLNKWLEYVSACDIGRVYFDVTAIKTTNLACTNASKVMAFPIPLPPHDEQECIINELNRITSRFNDARESLEKQIEYLQELRILLISDVVTGQIDVRGIEVPKHESVDDVVAESEVEELEVE